MSAPARNTADDYAGALRALLPTGPAWPKSPDSVQGRVLGRLALTPWRLDAAAQQLLVDAQPATTSALLAEWEATLGLQAGVLSVDQRRAAIIAQLVAVGGQSRAAMIAAAAALGVTITVTTYAPFRAGIGRCGQPLAGPAWAFAWSAAITANPGSVAPAALLAALRAIAPAETTVFLT